MHTNQGDDPEQGIREEMAFQKLFCFEQNVQAETESVLWCRMVEAEDAPSPRGCSFDRCLSRL